MDVILHSLVIHPALLVYLLVVGSIAVELRPDGNHETTTHGMYRVEHRLRIGIASGLKLVRAPLVLLPVVPVLHDVVTRYLALTELGQVLLYLA